jgi:signal transduction histidine kinase/DNA-binding response OmpR family regulator/ligand-binding sensor domain-containing protein
MSVKQIRAGLTFLLISTFFDLHAGEITVRRIPVTEQLPSNTVCRTFQDKDGFVWLGTRDGFCRYDGYEMKSFRSETANPTFPSNNITGGFAEDTLNRTIWIGTEKGVLILDERTHAITPLDTALLGQSPVRQILYTGNAMWICSDFGLYLYNPDRTLRKKYMGWANSIHIDNRGTVRVTAWTDGLYCLDKETDTFVPYPKIGSKNNPHKIFQDRDGCFWVCTWGDGLFRFYPDRQQGELYEPVIMPDDKKTFDFGIFFDIEQDDVNGYLWALSYAGVTVFKPEAGCIAPVNRPAAVINDQTSLFNDVMKDRDGNLWFGTEEQGAILVNPAPSVVTSFGLSAIKTETGYIPNIVRVFEDREGELWLSQSRLGKIYLFDRTADRLRKLDIPGFSVVASVCNYSALNEIWVATEFVPSILRLRKTNGQVSLLETMDMRTVLAGHSPLVLFLHEDKKGVVWAATPNTLLAWEHGNWKIACTNCGIITGITEDCNGAIWISTRTNGLWQIIPEGDKTVAKNFNTKTCRIAGNTVSCISAGADGCLWFCVNERQLYSYDITSQLFTDYTSSANVNNRVIQNVIAGDSGHVWIASNKQVIEFNPVTGASIQFDAQSSMAISSLNKDAITKTGNGSLILGGNGGICLLASSPKVDIPCEKVKTVITDIKTNGKSFYQRQLNREGRDWRNGVVLFPNETNLEISFSSFNYLNPDKVRYACKLEGIDEQWTYLAPGRSFAVYNQLRKGKYSFLLKSTGDNQLWDDEVTRIIVLKSPAFYETGWAYAAYTLMILFIIFAGLKFYDNRVRLRNELHIAQIDRKKSEELMQAKLRFFTNIGHEFRTPLTLIMTPLNTLIHQLTDESLKQKLMAVYRNAEDMLGLINQLLDFRKLEMGGEKLKLSCDDFVKFAEYVYFTFKDLAENKSIHFTFESSIKQLFMSFDKSKVRKIINNLYSNALKFTPEGGYIATTLSLLQENGRKSILLNIMDSGCGIPDGEQQMIFDRFYQSENSDSGQTGSGIGLHLVKEYVELHGGRISVASKIDEGSVFSVSLPTDLQIPGNEADSVEIHTHEPLQLPETHDNRKQKTLLLVEDNAELRRFLTEQLESRFNVLQAANGEQGAAIALKNSPDLIVSDLMMPVLNGLEMCRRLKTDIQTSHIPIILLTAKLSDETKIETYKAGADSYIAKPFNFEVLLTRIDMLIEQQEKRRKLFHKVVEITPSSITTTALDEDLIKKALYFIEMHLNDVHFDRNTLANAMCMSYSTLYRKLLSLTGLPPNDFIQNVRLKHAWRMLQNEQMTVTEVADATGFSNSKYFSRCFKKEFGILPKELKTKNCAMQ